MLIIYMLILLYVILTVLVLHDGYFLLLNQWANTNNPRIGEPDGRILDWSDSMGIQTVEQERRQRAPTFSAANPHITAKT